MKRKNIRLSRHDFIKLSILALGGSVLTACNILPVSPTGPESGATPPTSTAAPTDTLTAARPTTLADPTRTGKGQKGTKVKEETIPASGNSSFIVTELLGRPTDSSVTANIVPAVAINLFYEYGIAPGSYSSRTSPQSVSAGVPIETSINGLESNTRYYYRLNYNNTVGQEHSFVTRRSPGTSFTFGIQGDSHPERLNKEFSPLLYPITLQAAGADQPDFYITMGDDFGVDTLKTVNADTVRQLYLHQRQWLGLVGAPVFLVNGNHEQAAQANLNGTADNVAVWAQTARNSLFPQPVPGSFYSGDSTQIPFIGLLRDYYAWTWGDALFVVLDQYWHSPVSVDNKFGSDHDPKGNRDLWQVTVGDEQYQWFRNILESSPAKYKFVFSHHVLGTQRGGIDVADQYEWGDSANLATYRPNWGKTIHQVMADNHVTIYFQGHDHIFVRQELDGVIYQTLPQPADPNYALNNATAYHSGDKLPSTGYLRVNVSPTQVTVNYIRTYLPQDEINGHTSGQVAYSYTV